MDKIALYMRLSKEDDRIQDESNSITNQRAMLKRYIRGQKDLINKPVVEFVDDGISGKTVNRPGLQEMLEGVKKREITTIIVKDISRFSRDYLVSGKYLEQIFPFMGVRFIAINDHYDSNDYVGGIGEIDVAFKELLYDFYSEDLSEKVRTSLKARKAKGKFIACYAPYGYKKSKEDRNKLEIDGEAAEIVRRIFREYLDGVSMFRIAKNLNEDGIPARSDYARSQGINFAIRQANDKPIWDTSAVSSILHNRMYVGDLVYGKYKNEAVAGQSKKAPKEEVQIVENAHPAIISREDFEMADKKMEQNIKSGRDSWGRKRVHERHVLAGKVICGNCGHVMTHSYTGKPKYICSQRHFSGDMAEYADCVKSVRDEDLENVILTMLQLEADLSMDYEKIRKVEQQKHEEKAKKAEKHLREMMATKEKLLNDTREAYESYKMGMTDKETYLVQKSSYDSMLKKLSDSISKQEQAVDVFRSEQAEYEKKGIQIGEDGVKFEKLTKEMVDAFVKEVRVYAKDQIEIVWSFRKPEVDGMAMPE